MIRRTMIAGLVLLACSAPAWAGDVTDDRSAGFKASKRAMAEIQDAIAAQDTARVAVLARDMARFGGRIPHLFPPGSIGGWFSGARSAIWEDFPDFQRKAQAFTSAAQSLADLAETGTEERGSLLDAHARLGETCRDCHRPYKTGF